jgi:hypothetical protein
MSLGRRLDLHGRKEYGRVGSTSRAVNRLDLNPTYHGPGFIRDFNGVSGSAAALRLCGDCQIAGAVIALYFRKAPVWKLHALFVWDDFPAVAYVEKVPWHLIAPISPQVIGTIGDGSTKSAKV